MGCRVRVQGVEVALTVFKRSCAESLRDARPMVLGRKRSDLSALTAMCSGVAPSAESKSTVAPALSSNSTQSACPCDRPEVQKGQNWSGDGLRFE